MSKLSPLFAFVFAFAWIFGRAVNSADLETAVDFVRAGRAAEAVAVFRELAQSGNSTAQVNLAIMHARGEGVPQDDVEAAYWIWRARVMGDQRAARHSELLLGRLPKRARNEMAARLAEDIEGLADGGQVHAFVALGRLETEVKQPPKPQSAAVWFTLAAAFEVRFARALREASTAELSDVARLKVQSQAREAFAEWCQRVPLRSRPASCPDAESASMEEKG